jgi:dCTP diphosphatase
METRLPARRDAPDQCRAGARKRNLRKCFPVNMNPFEQIKTRLRDFAADRDWDQFHSPKNLSMALIVEASELVEHFQWLKQDESLVLSPEKLNEVAQEIADIQIYLVRIADKLGVDIEKAVDEKIAINEQKYPADKVRGSAGDVDFSGCDDGC